LSKEIIEIEGVGEVILLKSKRAKRIRITIKSGGIVRVTVPYLVSYRRAKGFVLEKQDWIRKHCQEQKEKLDYTIFDEDTEFRTKLHALKFFREERDDFNCTITDKVIIVTIPKSTDILSHESQQFIRKCIEESWRKEAKEYLPKRTRVLAAEYGFEFSKVTIRNTTSRWGSCSFTNNINYSLHLMRVPNELIDYVILHELAHTKEKNHQPPFWDLLDSVTGGKAKFLDKQLKDYTTKVY
jgi:predicted metal-dependent hydrolase